MPSPLVRTRAPSCSSGIILHPYIHYSAFLPAVLPDLKYASSHEWAKAEGETATVGISDHAQVGAFIHWLALEYIRFAHTLNSRLQGELGDVVYVELPEVGSTVTKGETFGVVESVKVRATYGIQPAIWQAEAAALLLSCTHSSSSSASAAIAAVGAADTRTVGCCNPTDSSPCHSIPLTS